MPSRVSIPLTICLVASAIAVIALTGVFESTAETAQPAADAAQPAAETPAATDGAAANPSPVTPSITIANFSFGEPITVQAGQTVSVENVDGVAHTLTTTTAGTSFDTGNLGGGASGSFVAPTDPGTYAFFCQIHPSMTGTLTVSG